MKYNLEAICKHNVDRSRNQLVENLKSTLCTLASMNCSNTSVRVQIDLEDSGLHFAMTFQTRDCLKQFQTIHCSFFVETLKAVGQCCPLLKLLKLNKQFSGGMLGQKCADKIKILHLAHDHDDGYSSEISFVSDRDHYDDGTGNHFGFPGYVNYSDYEDFTKLDLFDQ
ncbi:F-box protein SKIP19-like [Benincasa hispida]|uniref:F-box protein SKIP19-like n=1 Tax=Benincasa hispida TaxID=102211 RepID=UPI00190029B5|nr:F-box protein SKIP19-like [Benincasa hispida]